MQECDMKISNIFKEKKKESNRLSSKQITKDNFLEENIISLLNKKRKKSNSKDKDININKIFKQNNNIENHNKNNKLNKSILNDEMSIRDDENTKNKKNIFEISETTKKILEKISAKKNREKQKQRENEIKNISNSYNIDYYFYNNNPNINKKKASPPKLSSKTMEIIQKISEKRKNRFDREKHDNMDKIINRKSSFSTLHLKYEELISEKRELRLPIKYKELLNAFNNMEHIINLNKIEGNNKLITFENIKSGIESMAHRTFNLKILKQILYVVPHFYILKYIKKNEIKSFKLNDEEIDKNFDLIIEIPSDYQKRMEKYYEKNFDFSSINYYKENDSNFNPNQSPLNLSSLEKRKEIFKNILYLIVNNYHDLYLKKLKITSKFNPLEQKTWYHKFDPDNECEDIPEYDLPQPPNSNSIFESIIEKNDLKKEIMNNHDINILNETNNETKNIKGNKYVSQIFLNKLRAKERANSVINEIQNYNIYHNSLKDMSKIYKEILIQTKTVLLTNKNIHKLKDVAEMVLNSNNLIKDNLNEIGKVMNAIKKICNKYNEIINVINHSYLGPVVVLVNKDAEIPEKIEL